MTLVEDVRAITRELADVDIAWGPVAPAEPMPADADVFTDALIEAESYRLLAQQAIHALAAAHERDLQHREQLDRLHDELRRLRVLLLESQG